MAMERVQRALDASEIVGQEEGPCAVSYTSRDLIIYALGVGAADLMYLHEGGGSFSSFPTFPLVLPYKGTSDDIVPFPGPTLFLIPEGLRDAVEPGAILHYDQSIRVLEPLDPGGAELESRSVVLGVYRRRGGALLRTKTTLTDTSSGRTMAETTQRPRYLLCITMAPSLSAVCTFLCLGTSAAFVAPSVSSLSRGVTASHHHRVTQARPRASKLPPFFMAAAGSGGDKKEIDPEVLAKVRGIVVSQLAVEEGQVVPEASFTQDLGADSLDTVELIMALEEGFDIEIEDEVAAEISTVQQAVDFISKSPK